LKLGEIVTTIPTIGKKMLPHVRTQTHAVFFFVSFSLSRSPASPRLPHPPLRAVLFAMRDLYDCCFCCCRRLCLCHALGRSLFLFVVPAV
jgi:hypothetical protein